MKINKKTAALVVGTVALSLVGGAALTASATPTAQTNGSDAAVYTYDTDGVYVPDSSPMHVWKFLDDVLVNASETDLNAAWDCAPGDTGAAAFISPVGSERTVSAWKAYAPIGKALAGNSVNIGGLINGAPAGVATAGGDYSLGVVCTINNGVTVTAAYYRTIHVVAGTADTATYTMDAVTLAAAPTATPTPAPSGTSGDVALAPSVADANNGVLSLSVPTSAAAVFSAPSLVNNKSTTLGTLGAVTVADGRVVTRQGWDVSANVADFVNGSSTIAKSQLGVAPAITSTEAVGVTVGTTQVAGASTFPFTFASGAAANKVGTTVLGANLTFVAPQEKAAGTYTSTMTLTVVSK
jgi:hypothetical protein